MIKILHLADLHLGSGTIHGRINPQTRLNSRLEDFTNSLAQCIDRALAEPVDLVLFAGDAFPDATPPPLVQEAFARQFCRLAEARLPTVLLVGNHDQHSQGQGGASLAIYRTLRVPGFVVGDQLATHHLETAHGPVQVITLPWFNRSALLTRQDTQSMSLAEVDEYLVKCLRTALEEQIRGLDPSIPAILLGHLMVDTAIYGAERSLAVGKGFTVPLSLLARPCFDYVALGHVHRHQILAQSPPVVYPGSLERVDFGEEEEEKGYVMATIARGQAQVTFCPLAVRPFQTIRVNATAEPDPQARILQAIGTTPIQEAVVRLIYQIRPAQVSLVKTQALEEALRLAHTYRIVPEVTRQDRSPRQPDLGLDNCLDPLEALATYLAKREDLGEIRQELLEAAERLLAGLEDPEALDSVQLRLM